MRLSKPEPHHEYHFGNIFTDHMFEVDWDYKNGWSKPEIHAYRPIQIDTTASVLHYGISCFEGISVVKNAVTGHPQAFRADDNLNSFYDSSTKLDLPAFDKDELLNCLKKLVHLDESWFPAIDDPS